jgi:hypothetical protein
VSSDLAAVASVIRSIAQLKHSGALAQLGREIHRQSHEPDGFRDPDFRTSAFTGMAETEGAGVAAVLLARLPDGRQVSWMVEVWIDTWQPGGEWSAVVKGDVDRDLTIEEFPDDECPYLEQRTVHDVADIPAAVREMAELVVQQDVR